MRSPGAGYDWSGTCMHEGFGWGGLGCGDRYGCGDGEGG